MLAASALLGIALFCASPQTVSEKGASSPSIPKASPLASVPKTEKAALDQKPTLLSFKEFFESSPQELKPSAKLLSLNGKRVRIVGFMAQMEEPIRGGFYLCPRPTFCDESGGGTAELPPGAIRVLVRSAKGKELAFIPRALEATGVLEVGPVTHEDGQVSRLRLILDRPQKAAPSPGKSAQKPLANLRMPASPKTQSHP